MDTINLIAENRGEIALAALAIGLIVGLPLILKAKYGMSGAGWMFVFVGFAAAFFDKII